MPDMLDSLILSILDDLYLKSPGTMLSITALLALWSAARGMMGIERGLNRESKGKQQPANGCKNSPRQLLPGVLFFCGNNGVEQYKGKQDEKSRPTVSRGF